MPERIQHIAQELQTWWMYILFALAAVSGLGGGCTVAIVHMIKDERKFTKALFAAYGIVGLINSVLAFVFVRYIVEGEINSLRLVSGSFIFGAISTSALLAQNISTRWTLKVMGKEVVEMRGDSDE